MEFGVLCFTPGREADSEEQGSHMGCPDHLKKTVAVWRRTEFTGEVRGCRKEGRANIAVSCREEVCGLAGRWGGQRTMNHTWYADRIPIEMPSRIHSLASAQPGHLRKRAPPGFNWDTRVHGKLPLEKQTLPLHRKRGRRHLSNRCVRSWV